MSRWRDKSKTHFWVECIAQLAKQLMVQSYTLSYDLKMTELACNGKWLIIQFTVSDLRLLNILWYYDGHYVFTYHVINHDSHSIGLKWFLWWESYLLLLIEDCNIIHTTVHDTCTESLFCMNVLRTHSVVCSSFYIVIIFRRHFLDLPKAKWGVEDACSHSQTRILFMAFSSDFNTVHIHTLLNRLFGLQVNPLTDRIISPKLYEFLELSDHPHWWELNIFAVGLD